ncbi:MAG TPA: serine hydrolase domain-containing protein [Anaerolineales bacterium]|nr:serine hydrolase domain-containing protein [Anaerolineales bacterium]
MIRDICTVYARLSVVLICLISTACSGRSISVAPSAIATERPAPSPTLNPEDPASKIDKILSYHTEREMFTGSVLVARNGEILLSQGYGWADRENQIPNTPQTKYRLGSITKQFTAMAILILEAEGQLDVQDRICRYVPECPDSWQEITIHHLLSHTSGVPNLTDFPDYETFKATPTTPEQTVARFKDKPLDFQPGEKWNYSNSGYILLGHIIEQVCGQSYEMFLQQNIFEPLQMTNTGYDHNDGSLATGYTGMASHWDEPDYIDMTLPYAAGGLYSTVENLYLWDQALYTDQLVSKQSLDMMFIPHAKIAAFGLSYGYGWFVGQMNQHQAVSHGGGIDGFITEIRRYSDDEVTIIILSNRETTNVPQIADQIASVVFEK